MKPKIKCRESARKRAKRSPLRKSCAGCPHATICAYMHAINDAPISNAARYLAGVIALDLDVIGDRMRKGKHCFFNAVRASTDPCSDECLRRLLRECVNAGVLEPGIIDGRGASLPRLPDWVQPC